MEVSAAEGTFIDLAKKIIWTFATQQLQARQSVTSSVGMVHNPNNENRRSENLEALDGGKNPSKKTPNGGARSPVNKIMAEVENLAQHLEGMNTSVNSSGTSGNHCTPLRPSAYDDDSYNPQSSQTAVAGQQIAHDNHNRNMGFNTPGMLTADQLFSATPGGTDDNNNNEVSTNAYPRHSQASKEPYVSIPHVVNGKAPRRSQGGSSSSSNRIRARPRAEGKGAELAPGHPAYNSSASNSGYNSQLLRPTSSSRLKQQVSTYDAHTRKRVPVRVCLCHVHLCVHVCVSLLVFFNAMCHSCLHSL